MTNPDVRGRALRVATHLLALACAGAAPANAQSAPAQPLTLPAVIRAAGEHYPAVRAAAEQQRAADAAVDLAHTASLPRLDVAWQAQRGTANNVFGQLLPQGVIPPLSGPALASTSAGTVWGTAVGGLLTWEPIDLGLRGAATREAQAGLERSRAEAAMTVLQVQTAAAQAFFAVAVADRAVTAATADAQRREVLARTTHVLVENELRAGAEASRADAELAAARTRVLQAQQARAVASATLARLLGLDTADLAVETSGLTSALPAATDAPANASHPAVAVGDARLTQARARAAVIDASDRPRLLLQSALFARGTGAHPDGLLDGGATGLWPQRTNWSAGVQVQIPNLFEAPARHARQRAAAASIRVADAQRAEAELGVATDRRAATAVLQTSLAIATHTPVQVDAARQTERQARARYEAGLAGIADVADAQRLLADAEYVDAVARLDAWRAAVAQAVASGSLEGLLTTLAVQEEGR